MSQDSSVVDQAVPSGSSPQQIFLASVSAARDACEALIELSSSNKAAVELLVKKKSNSVVTCGLGKSGYIAAKFAATLTSLGIRARYLHASEALHGDLGCIAGDCTVIGVSNSGETQEIIAVLREAKARGATCLAITGSLRSSIAQLCDGVLSIPSNESVCRQGVAPMSSTTCTLVVCDAIANVLVVENNLTLESFKRNHPAGALGKGLNLLRKEMEPLRPHEVSPNELVIDCIHRMEGCGLVLVRDKSKIAGIFTDGDLRRLVSKNSALLSRPISEFYSASPISLSASTTVFDAEELMRLRGVTSVLVHDDSGVTVGLYRK